MTLFAISDLHVGYAANKAALARISPHPGDWLILAGDIGETVAQLEFTLDQLQPKFAQLLWVPGNHELWSRREEPGLAGVQKYEALVAGCRKRGVLTPEDPYALYAGSEGPRRIALLFTLYDYSFSPTPMTPEEALQWAIDQGVLCSDEAVLSATPYTSRAAWCAAPAVTKRSGGSPRHARSTHIPWCWSTTFRSAASTSCCPDTLRFPYGAGPNARATGRPGSVPPKWSMATFTPLARDLKTEFAITRFRSATQANGTS